MSERAGALLAALALATAAVGCGPEAIPDDEAPQPFEGKAVAIGAGGSVLVPGVRGPVGDRGCQQSLAAARLDAEGRTTGRAGVVAGSIDDSCRPKVDRVIRDRQGRLVIYGTSFDPALIGGGERGPSVLLRLDASGRLDPGFGDGGVSVDPDLSTPFAALPDGRLVDSYGTVVDRSETEARALNLPRLGVRGAYPEEMVGLYDGLALVGDGIEVSRLDENARPTVGYGTDGVASVLAGGEESARELIDLGAGAVGVLSDFPTPLGRTPYRPVLRRVAPGGEQDGDFGERGGLDLASALGEGFFLGAVDALPDGRLVVIGAERPTGRVVIARFTAAGRADKGFGRRGVRRLDVGVGPLSANAEPEIDLALARDGSVTGLVGGSFRTPTRLMRLRPDGALDRRFGSDGVRRLDSL